MRESDKVAFIKLLEQAEKDKFYGEVTFRFRDGTMYQIFKGQSIKPEDLITDNTK